MLPADSHDVLYLRQVLGLGPAPEFEVWLEAMGVMSRGRMLPVGERHRLLEAFLPGGNQ